VRLLAGEFRGIDCRRFGHTPGCPVAPILLQAAMKL